MTTKVQMVNGNATAELSSDQVPIWEKAGWKRVDPQIPKPQTSVTGVTASDGDPSGETNPEGD